MPKGYQARALLRGLVKFGEPSVLAGLACGHVSIQRNVAIERSVEPYPGFSNARENVTIARHTVAGIDRSFNPRSGQVLVHPDGAFLLDRLIEDNGIVSRFIVTPTVAPVSSVGPTLAVDGTDAPDQALALALAWIAAAAATADAPDLTLATAGPPPTALVVDTTDAPDLALAAVWASVSAAGTTTDAPDLVSATAAARVLTMAGTADAPDATAAVATPAIAGVGSITTDVPDLVSATAAVRVSTTAGTTDAADATSASLQPLDGALFLDGALLYLGSDYLVLT